MSKIENLTSVERLIGLLVLLLALACIGLFSGLMVEIFRDKTTEEKDSLCSVEDIFPEEDEPDSPGIFADLTRKEIEGLKNYLYEKSGLNLVKPSDSKKNANFVFVAELHLPNKSDAIQYLDHKGPQPPREAKVIMIRGEQPNQEINELVVGPLPNATYHHPVPGINASLPYFYRPMTEEDYGSVTENITAQVHDNLGDLIEHCFNAKLKDCGDTCLAFLYASSFSPGSSGVNERKTWYWLTYDVEYYTLLPVDFSVLASIKPEGVHLDVIWFQGKQYPSMDSLSSSFKNGSITCTPQPFPKNSKTLFSTLHQRGFIPGPHSKKRQPTFVEPDGRRYTVSGKHVDYMQWSFDFRLSTSYGPQLYDIRFNDTRIIYELGLQEISVFYSGNSPQQRFSDYMDSAELIGPSANGLVPGVDCPEHATFYNTMHVTETSEEQDTVRNVFCLFELNTGEPLRRHHSYWKSEGSFYEGIENTILVLRTAVTVVNYDYVFDFRFFQNGVIEVKGMSTGYVLANAFSPEEKRFGFQIHDYIVASFHTHLFNFKVDIDVNGESNRYDTINITPVTEHNEFSARPNSTYSQGIITRHLKQTEREAAYKFDFDAPKYHIFYNNDHNDTYGNSRAYRLIHNGMVKQILPEGHNKEPAINWARYQFAVTKRKDAEAHSSSMYSMFDINDQVVNFQGYIDDNETIVDQDLVLWVTLGVHHIPHTEDLPLTTTSGMGLSFFLQPYNYFPEDPSMASSNAVRMEPKESGVHVERYGVSREAVRTCAPKQNNFEQKIQEKPELVFEQE